MVTIRLNNNNNNTNNNKIILCFITTVDATKDSQNQLWHADPA